jgi:hypothetical protein
MPDNRSMAFGRRRVGALLAGALLIVCACSSSHGHPSPGASSSQARPSAGASSSATVSESSAVQTYLDAVDQLCDALLPKVVAVTHGGSLDIPIKDYLAQQPAHAKLLADFDRQLAMVAVPAAAKDKAAAFAAYVSFANQLDAKRLAAAKRGAAAYAAQIKSEASAESDPTVTARNAAGFDQSCDAR